MPEESQVGPGLNETAYTTALRTGGSGGGRRVPRALSATFVAVTVVRVVSRLLGVAAETSPPKYRHHSS